MDAKVQKKEAHDLSVAVSDIGSRLRVLEERYANLRKKTQITDQNMIENERGMIHELEELNQKVLDVKHSIFEMNEKITIMLGELSNCVKEEDFKVYARYIDLWDPSSFVTKETLARKDL